MVFFKTVNRSYEIIKKINKCIVVTPLCTMFRINVILHWNSFGLLWGTLVMFVWLFFSCLFLVPHSSQLSWVDFPFCAGWQCWFQLHAGRFVACSVFTCGGIPSIPFSKQKDPPPPTPGQGVSLRLLPPQHYVDGPGAHLICCTKVCPHM